MIMDRGKSPWMLRYGDGTAPFLEGSSRPRPIDALIRDGIGIDNDDVSLVGGRCGLMHLITEFDCIMPGSVDISNVEAY